MHEFNFVQRYPWSQGNFYQMILNDKYPRHLRQFPWNIMETKQET